MYARAIHPTLLHLNIKSRYVETASIGTIMVIGWQAQTERVTERVVILELSKNNESMSKCKKCAECAYFNPIAGWYYDECLAGPMAVEPTDPACQMFKEKEE